MTSTNNMVLYFNKEIFSPYYKCEILFPSIEIPWFKCNSVLHCFEISKLMFFHNYDRLFYASTLKLPKDCIRVGYEINNYNKQKWSEAKYDIMYQIEFQKYLQNENLQSELFSSKYDNIEFVYTNPLDAYWGIGVGEYTSMAVNKEKWKGQNKHGQIISKVRQDLIDYYDRM